MPANSQAQLVDVATHMLDRARHAGASSADIMVSSATEFEVKVADGEIITLTQATSKGLGLRVFVDGRLGFCTTSDFSRDSLAALSQRAIALARETTTDPNNGIAEGAAGRGDASKLCLYDPKVVGLSVDDKISWAHALESAARAADPRVVKFRESGVGTTVGVSVLASSSGALYASEATAISAWCNPIAVQDGDLQTEVWYDAKTHLCDLESMESIGRTAGQRAARMLGARPIKTQEVPVIFEPSVAVGLAAGMLGALDGDMVYKRASFLVDKLNSKIAADGFTLVDDPLLRRGLGSSPVDGEGLNTARRSIVDRGTLTTYLYDSYTARKAQAHATASARRSHASLPRIGAFNLYVAAGSDDPGAIVRSADRALIVTRGLGSGLNPVTGEYSRGANGLWVEHGEIIHPVQEVTIAGDYLSMLKSIDRIGSDLALRGTIGAPTVRVASMMVSGL